MNRFYGESNLVVPNAKKPCDFCHEICEAGCKFQFYENVGKKLMFV